MGRSPKSNASPLIVEVSENEIPGWVLEVPAPEGEGYLDLLNEARWQPSLVYNPAVPACFREYFARLAERGREEADSLGPRDQQSQIALVLLDLVPGYLEVLDLPSLRWIRDHLSYVFTYRRYGLINNIKKSVGAPKSAGPRAATVDHLVAAGMPVGEAIRTVATSSQATPDAIEKEREREHKKRAARDDRVLDGQRRLGIDAAGSSKVLVRIPVQPGSTIESLQVDTERTPPPARSPTRAAPKNRGSPKRRRLVRRSRKH